MVNSWKYVGVSMLLWDEDMNLRRKYTLKKTNIIARASCIMKQKRTHYKKSWRKQI